MKSSGIVNLIKCSMVLLPLYGAFSRYCATSGFLEHLMSDCLVDWENHLGKISE